MATVGRGLSDSDVAERQFENRSRRVILTIRKIRCVMAAKESLVKFGVFVPRSEREADASPEAPRWLSVRDAVMVGGAFSAYEQVGIRTETSIAGYMLFGSALSVRNTAVVDDFLSVFGELNAASSLSVSSFTRMGRSLSVENRVRFNQASFTSVFSSLADLSISAPKLFLEISTTSREISRFLSEPVLTLSPKSTISCTGGLLPVFLFFAVCFLPVSFLV